MQLENYCCNQIYISRECAFTNTIISTSSWDEIIIKSNAGIIEI